MFRAVVEIYSIQNDRRCFEEQLENFQAEDIEELWDILIDEFSLTHVTYKELIGVYAEIQWASYKVYEDDDDMIGRDTMLDQEIVIETYDDNC